MNTCGVLEIFEGKEIEVSMELESYIHAYMYIYMYIAYG